MPDGPDADARSFLLTAEQMRAADRAAVDRFGVDAMTLMENAGAAAWRVLAEAVAPGSGAVAVLAGKGNNGGDALVLARLAQQAGRAVRVGLMVPPGDLRAEAAEAYRRARDAGLAIQSVADADPRGLSDLLAGAAAAVDGILGTGITGPPRAPAAAAIRALNAAPEECRVLSLDIPSGLDADRGIPYEPCVRAHATVTFATAKIGLLMGSAAPYVGDLRRADIGMPAAALGAPAARLLLPGDVGAALPDIPFDAHKGTRGRVWIVAGSRGMGGAAVLCARGALRGGAGLVHVAIPAGERRVVAAAVPEALTLGLPEDGEGRVSPPAAAALADALTGADAVVLGPGLGRSDGAREVVRRVYETFAGPAVIDADALNLLAEQPVPTAAGPRILTPHPGEAARLLGGDLRAADIQADRTGALVRLAERWAAVIVLKGARTLIGAPGAVPLVNPTGHPALAIGGSGDVLAGLIGALCAQGMVAREAAACGVFLHGWSGQRLAERLGADGVIAGDLPLAIARARADLTRPKGTEGILAACGLFGFSRWEGGCDAAVDGESSVNGR